MLANYEMNDCHDETLDETLVLCPASGFSEAAAAST